MTNINIISLLILFITTSCQSIFQSDEESGYPLINIFAKEVKITDNLRLIGFGGGSCKGLSYDLTFLSPQSPNLDEARALYYKILTRFLNLINTNDILRSRTEGNVFTVENVTLLIIFPDVEGYITGVDNGAVFDRDPLQYVYYLTYNSELQRSKTTYKEPYEQVKSIVESQGFNCSSN